MCEIVEVKEELLEDVPTRVMFWECRRDFDVTAVSESPESEELEELVDFGGESSSVGTGTATRSYGLRVRRIGPLLSILLFDPCEFVESSSLFFGNVRAQFSHGMALFLSLSSYVLRKLESPRCLFVLCSICKATTRGLSGGVSIVAGSSCALVWLWKADRCDASSLSEDEEFALLAPRPRPVKLSMRADRRELVLGRLVLLVSSSKHDVQSTRRPSVTINGVGP